MSDITLSAGVRQNLLSLQNTADLLSLTQNRLATGKKVNSALDNPTNFFTSQNLSSRANDLGNLLDGISNAIKTIEAADNGITSITRLVEQAQSKAREALQEGSNDQGVTEIQGLSAIDTAGSTGTNTRERALNQDLSTLLFESADTISITTTNSSGTASTATFTLDGTGNLTTASTVQDLVDEINNSGIATASVTDDGRFTISSNSASSLQLNIDATDDGTGSGNTTAQQIAAQSGIQGLGFALNNTDINGTDSGGGGLNTNNDAQDPGGTDITFTDASTAANSAVQLQILNQASAETVDLTALVEQYNEILDQIDDLAYDASYNGVNLINSTTTELSVAFNERRDNNKSELIINGVDLSSLGLNLTDATSLDTSDANAKLDELTNAISELRSTGSRLGSQISIVQIREDFTKESINTLQTGADALVLADSNEEGANVLALQTRQQLSTTALSLASQADQAVLRLF